ncbi:RHS repeat-associated core domain-containing protein [Aquirhabdus parva]|uniref:RHS repeat-associated core domain-containing protein n=1 Tax=Aquirhabdus parva TaxID=2283318 RepID=UPI0013B3F49C|nr:RHS repeat-associated core domain-containing protein [Aquirhabdus parva]
MTTHHAFAAKGESQYKAAQMPNTQSCTVGRDMLSEEAEYDRTDIVGALPYSRHYETTLGYNQNRTNDMTDGQKSIGGWTDNYNNYAFVAGSSTGGIIRVRLPGDKDDTYYIATVASVLTYVSNGRDRRYPDGTVLTAQDKDKLTFQDYTIIVNQSVSSIQRIFSATPLIFEANYFAYGDGNHIESGEGDRVGYMSTDHRDRKLVLVSSSTISSTYTPVRGSKTITNSVNFNSLSFYVNNQGTIYQFQYQAPIGSIPVYKAARIIYPEGRTLGLSYETYGGIGLLAVADNRGHLLTFQRSLYMDGNALRSVVNQVSLSAQNGYTPFPDQQTVTYQYKTSSWTNFENGQNQNFYTISSAQSNLYGLETYLYNQKAGLQSAIIKNVGMYSDPYQVPVLTDVVNQLGETSLHWDYAASPTGSGWTMLKDSYKPFSPKNVLYTARSSEFGGSQVTGGSWSSNYTLTTDFNDSSATDSVAMKSSGDANTTEVNYTFNGFPCLTYNSKPVSAMNVDVRVNHVNYIIDANGNKTNFTYDGQNRIQTIEEAAGTSQSRTTTYTYGNLNNGAINPYSIPTVIQGPYQTITNTLNIRGQIVSQVQSSTQSGSAPKTYLYTFYEDSSQPNYGLLAMYDAPRSDVIDATSYSYDSFGNITSKTVVVNDASGSPVNRTTSYSNYNSAGLAKNISNPDSTSDTINYDKGYQILTKVHGSTTTSQSTSNTYDLVERLLTSTDADGKTTTYTYDSIGRPYITIEPNGNRTTYQFFPNNQISFIGKNNAQNTMFETTWTLLDSAGRVYYTRKGGDGNRLWSMRSFDANGNVDHIHTAQGIDEYWTYDAFNRVLTHTDGNGKVDTKTFDAADNNVIESAANSAGSTRYFKNQSTLATEINDDFGRVDYYHDIAENLIKKTQGDRSCVNNQIDQLGRQRTFYCSSTSNSDPKLIVNDNYLNDTSAFGNLDKVTSVTAYGVSTAYGYDLFGRVISKAQHNNTPVTWGYATSTLTNGYTYTSAGKLTSLTTPSGNVVSYNYSANGMLDNIQLNSTPIINNIGYDGASRLSYFFWGQGGSWQQWLNDGGELTQIKSTLSGGQTALQLNYGADLDGRITSQTIAGDNTATYGYDKNSQLLTESTSDGRSLTYTYDQNGNRTSLRSTGNWGFSYASEDYRYTANHMNLWTKNGGDAQPLGYTTVGELVSSYMGTSAYDHASRRRSESGVPGSTKYIGMYMDYNHKNERTFRGGSYIDRQYAYDESSHLIGEYGPTGTMIVEYIWMGDKPIAAVYPGNRIVYIVTDHQNKPRRGIDAATQQVVWSWNPDAYGAKKPIESGAQINLRFPGQYYDEQSGLYYNHNRYYNPELGRYMEPDPIGLKGGLNPYSYAGNNPVNNVDINGLNILRFLPVVGDIIDVMAMSDGEAPGGGFKNAASSNMAKTAAKDSAALAEKSLPNSALVCRGGACKADSFANGSGVTKAADGTLQGVSTQSRAGATVEELSKPFKNNQVGVTTVGKIREAGGKVTADGHPNNPNHATVDNLTPQQLEGLFSPTRANPVPPNKRGF